MKTPDDHTTWEREMGETFERRVRDLHETPHDLSAVKGRAVSIRRRRRAAIAGGILAAAAVIVPIAIIASNAADGRADGIDPAVPSVTVTDPSTPSPTPAVGGAGVGGYLEVGSGPALLHLSDRSVIELPRRDYTGAAVLGEQIAAFRQGGQYGEGFVDLVQDGAAVTTYDVRSPMTVAPDGLTVAFITTDDELLFVNAERGEQSLGDVAGDVILSAIVGNGDCAVESGCLPFLEYANFGEGEAFEINYEGPDTAPAPGALRVNDAAGFLVSVLTEATDTGSCGGLYDREGGGSWLFETCDAQVLDISPTAEYVVGTDPYGDGIGPRYFSILDATTGAELSRYESNPGFVYADFAWADDTHAVATVNVDGAWQIVSLGVDGSVEVLVGPVTGKELEAPFLITRG